jgi:type III restriction enzyme
VNYVVLDGVEDNSWERAAAQHLEAIPDVDSYVKNDHLEFRIPYRYAGRPHWYIPDFIVKLRRREGYDTDHYLILEISGGRKDPTRMAIKARTARDQWCAAVNNHKGHGVWGYHNMFDPNHFRSEIIKAIEGIYSGGPYTGLHADALKTTGGLISNDEQLAEWFPGQDPDDALFRDFFITQTAPEGN